MEGRFPPVQGLPTVVYGYYRRRKLDSALFATARRTPVIKEVNDYAKQLLKLRPDAADAWLALGAANYIIGCLPAHVRFFLWFGRIHGDKHLGMEQLSKAAEKGHYLMPFAKIFLALVAMRRKV